MNKTRRPLVLVSAVALREGGPLSILKEAIHAAGKLEHIQFIFIVHKKTIITDKLAKNIWLLPMPRAIQSYLQRLIVEYVIFAKIAKRLKPSLWLSLHDTSPRVGSTPLAVYCHNPLPAWDWSLKHLFLAPLEVLRACVYGLNYKFNSKAAFTAIIQQAWFAHLLKNKVRTRHKQFIISPPMGINCPKDTQNHVDITQKMAIQLLTMGLFYPALPRVFKNHESIVSVARNTNLPVFLTLNGKENRYARYIARLARKDKNIHLIGKIDHLQVLKMMKDMLVVFPSNLETFGLPVLETIRLGGWLVVPVKPWTLQIASTYTAAWFYSTEADFCQILLALKKGEMEIARTISQRALTSSTSSLPADMNCVTYLSSGFVELFRHLLKQPLYSEEAPK